MEWIDYRASVASLGEFFSEFFTSGYIGAMKPEDEMYSKVFAGKDLSQEGLVYIDDNEKYVSVAHERYGVHAVLYKDLEDLLFWVR